MFVVKDEKALLAALDAIMAQIEKSIDTLYAESKRLVIMAPPRKLLFQAADVGFWRKKLEANANRYGFIVFAYGASVGNAYYAPKEMPTATEGVELIGGPAAAPYVVLDPHKGEVFVNVTAATVQLGIVEWIIAPAQEARLKSGN